MTQPTLPPKKENLLVNLVCNLVVPTLVLMKFSDDRWLGPLWGLIVALIFPVGYGIYDLITRKKTNFLSVLGFASVLLSGGLGLMKAEGFWFAVKDAAIPTVIGIAVLASLRTKNPLVRELFFNDQILDVPRVDSALDVPAKRLAFDRLRDRDMVVKLFDELGPRYKNRNGGYLRILKFGFRVGDNAPMALVELVDRPQLAEGEEKESKAA